MKIEKVNDSQIRCTLTSSDHERRHIRLSELAYGSEKAKLLFQDMMQEAHINYGFDSGTSPLMIEASPLSPDSIVLIITKVDDPEELDTRFSKFSPTGEEPASNTSARTFTGADELLELFRQLREKHSEQTKGQGQAETEQESAQADAQIRLVQAFRFYDFARITQAADALAGFYRDDNMLVKDAQSGGYDLVLHQTDCSPEDFNKVCNILTEYGEGRSCSPAAWAHIREHGDILIREGALAMLAHG